MASESLLSIRALEDVSFVTSHDVWLALEEKSDYKADCRDQLLELEWLEFPEASEYHLQLFYWLLCRRSNHDIRLEIIMCSPYLHRSVKGN